MRLVRASAFGAGIPLVLLISLGSLLTAGDPTLATSADPVAAINAMLPSWMAVPYLIAAFGGLLMSNHLSTYSAGLTMITLGIRVPRAWAVVLDVVLMFLGGIYFMLVADDFYGPFSTFLTLLAVPISAWIGVIAVDMVRGRHYDPAGLMDRGAAAATGTPAGSICPPSSRGWPRSQPGCSSPRPRPARTMCGSPGRWPIPGSVRTASGGSSRSSRLVRHTRCWDGVHR